MADRWPKADCLRDVFELLAREVPLVDRPSRPPTRVSEASAEIIRGHLPQIRSLIVHRSTVRMIVEMTSDEFPRLRGNQPQQRFASRRATPSREKRLSSIVNNQIPTGSPRPFTFELPFAIEQMFEGGNDRLDGTFSADELLPFPGVFDIDGWS